MKKISGSLIFLGIVFGTALGSENNFGLGFILGNPSGFSAKINTGKMNAVDLLLGYDSYPRSWDHRDEVLYLGGDYVWYNYSLITVARGKLPLYYGPGLKATVSGNSTLGIRGVVGLEYQFANAPFDAFFEIGPGIDILPGTEPDVTAGFGARFFF